MKKLLISIVTVAMLATGANAAFEKVNTYNNNFTDVKPESWYAESVKSAYELGLMTGNSDTTFNPNGNVTVAEAITMAARVHATNKGVEIKKEEKPAVAAGDEIRFDFDSLDGHRLNHAVGDVEDGILVMQPDAPNAGGNFDLGVFMDNLSVDASVYKNLTVRMKREALENINERRESFEIFFGSEVNPTLGDAGNFLYKTVENPEVMDDWYEYSFDMSAADGWKGNIVQIRFDPTNNNGKYYIDYIVLSSASGAAVPEEPKAEKWYDMYVDYAVANGLITKTTFANYTRNATRAELASLFAASLPAEGFAAINDIKGIPDVDKKASYAKDLLMLYNAGVVLGSDSEGTFNPDSDIKRSEVATIINRVALPGNRVKGSISAVWEEDAPAKVETPEVPKADESNKDTEHVVTPYDVEFNDPADLDKFAPGEVDSAEIIDGALVMVARDRGAERTPQYDPRLVMKDVSIDATTYKTIKIRLKADFIGEITNGYSTDIYFMTEGDENFSEEKSLHPNLLSVSKMDDEGWYLVEIDLTAKDNWKGNVVAFRFDPSNNNGKFSFDYIRFAK